MEIFYPYTYTTNSNPPPCQKKETADDFEQFPVKIPWKKCTAWPPHFHPAFCFLNFSWQLALSFARTTTKDGLEFPHRPFPPLSLLWSSHKGIIVAGSLGLSAPEADQRHFLMPAWPHRSLSHCIKLNPMINLYCPRVPRYKERERKYRFLSKHEYNKLSFYGPN